MQATARRLSVVSATSCARRRLIRNVRRLRASLMKAILVLGSLALLFAGAFVSFGSLGYMEYLRIAFPHWLHDTFLFAPIAFLGIALGARRVPALLRLFIAGGVGSCVVALPYFVFLTLTQSVQLRRAMTEPETRILIERTRGRFIVWSPSSPHSSILHPDDSDGMAAKDFLAEHEIK